MKAARAWTLGPESVSGGMEYRALGATGLRVSRLGLGLAALGRPAYHTLGHGADFPEGREPGQLEQRTHDVLDAAWAAGVRYVDAARSYGRAEEFLGAWLARRPLAEALVVGSKWGYRYVGEWRLDAERHEVKDHSLEALRAQAAESLALLGARLSLYQIHSATADGPILGDDAVLDELASLRDRGIRIGLTASGPRQAEVIRRALGVERGGVPLFESIQATWNLLERSAEPALEEAHAAGRGVIVKEPLANGRLGPRGDAASSLASAARGVEATPDAIALAAALARPWADVVLLGAVTVDQLRSNLGALRLTREPAACAVAGVSAEDPERYWRTRAALPWR